MEGHDKKKFSGASRRIGSPYFQIPSGATAWRIYTTLKSKNVSVSRTRHDDEQLISTIFAMTVHSVHIVSFQLLVDNEWLFSTYSNTPITPGLSRFVSTREFIFKLPG